MTAQRLVHALKPHFIISMAFFILLTFMASSADEQLRILLIAPALILYFAAFLSFGWEYDLVAKASAPAGTEPTSAAGTAVEASPG